LGTGGNKIYAQVVRVTLLREQYGWASERVVQKKLGKQIEIRLQDYRDFDARDGDFDKITSVGMFEHVGIKHLADYFSKYTVY
jgi:cyclopropane-fatty-acyl-phospholipid synthase